MSMIKIHNVENGEIVEREMNDQELLQAKIDSEKAKHQAEAKAAAQISKAALLEKLGITEEEAKLLLS